MSRSHFHPHKLETAGAPPVSGRRPVFLTAPCFVLPGLCLCVTSMRKGERDGGLPTLAPPPLRSVGSAPTCPWPRLLMHRGGGSVEQPVPVPHPTIQASLRHLGWRRAVSWASMSSAGTWAGRVGTRGVQLYPRTQGAGAAGESPAKRGSRDGRVPGPGDALCTLAASIAAPSVQALPLASRSEEAHWPGWAAPSGLCPVGLGASGPREGGNGVRGSTGEPGPA